jgi:hypothetical protein
MDICLHGLRTTSRMPSVPVDTGEEDLLTASPLHHYGQLRNYLVCWKFPSLYYEMRAF